MSQEMAMLHDISRCTACRACMVACKQWHDLPADMSTPFEGQYQSHADLTPTTWNLIRMNERIDNSGQLQWDFLKFQCMHCDDPACAKDAGKRDRETRFRRCCHQSGSVRRLRALRTQLPVRCAEN